MGPSGARIASPFYDPSPEAPTYVPEHARHRECVVIPFGKGRSSISLGKTG